MKESGLTWQQRAEAVLAQGCLTYSKSRRYYVRSQPSHVLGAVGQRLRSADGGTMLDTVSGLGANLISPVNSYSLPSTLEVEAAEKVISVLGRPGWKLKFVKTGSEADVAAARFMRAHAREKHGIWKVGYTGWGSEYIAAEEPGLGCPPTDIVKFSDHQSLLDALRSGRDLPAGVIMEPVILDIGAVETLKKILWECRRRAVLTCWDEVITCMRMPQYTVAATYNLWPDLITTGKALGGGYPLGVVMGRPDIMDTDGVFVSGTFSGEESALRACLGVLGRVTEGRLGRWCERCMRFQSRLEEAVRGKITVNGYGTRIVMSGDLYPVYMQEMWRRHRILMGPVLFPRMGWTREYDMIVDATDDVCRRLESASLDGPPPRPVFRRN